MYCRINSAVLIGLQNFTNLKVLESILWILLICVFPTGDDIVHDVIQLVKLEETSLVDLINSSFSSYKWETLSPVNCIFSGKIGTKHRCLYLRFKLIFIFKNIICSYVLEVNRGSLFPFLCFCSLYCLILWIPFFPVCCNQVIQHKHGCHEIALGMPGANYEKRLRYRLKKKAYFHRCLWPFIMGKCYLINAWNQGDTCNILLRDLPYWNPMTNLSQERNCIFIQSLCLWPNNKMSKIMY